MLGRMVIHSGLCVSDHTLDKMTATIRLPPIVFFVDLFYIFIISDPRRGCFMGLSTFIFFFFPPLLSGPYLWNRYSQRLQIECAAWSCCLILHYSLPSNSLHYFLFILFIYFFFAKILSGPYLWNCYSQRLQIECAAWSCSLILH